MSSRSRCSVFSLHCLQSIPLEAFIVMLDHKADSRLSSLNVVCVQEILLSPLSILATHGVANVTSVYSVATKFSRLVANLAPK